MLDVDLDNAVDLVLFDDCDPNLAGEEYWVIYQNAGTGFNPTFGVWTLPGTQYVSDDSFDSLSSDLFCPGGGVEVPAYEVFDINGDELVDLVVTDRCTAGGAGAEGEDYWEVHLGTVVGLTAGFDTAVTQWALPGAEYAGNETFDTTSAGQNCTSTDAQPEYLLADPNGDGFIDLLVTNSCDATDGIGEDVWWIYGNTGVGFDAAPTPWSLPGADFAGDDTFEEVTGELDCGAVATPTYALSDLDGDGVPEIVVTNLCGDSDIGENTWWVYDPTCVVP